MIDCPPEVPVATITFDTLKFSKRLKEAGILPAQAEAEAEALAEVLEVNIKELVTKDDLRHELELLRRDIDARFIQLEQRIIIKLGALMSVSVGAVAALVKLL
jgi:hypothetical protein